MMRYFVKLICVCLCAGFALAGCKKDSDPEICVVADNKIVATVANDADVDEVKGLIDESVVASGNYVNSKFTLQLPLIVNDEDLHFLRNLDGMKLSNPDAKVTSIDVFGYKDGKMQNEFIYGMLNADGSTTEGIYIYADSDLIITGTYSDEDYRETYSVFFKKGWNIMYTTDRESGNIEISEYTTKARSGMVWFYYDSEGRSFQQESISRVAGSQKRLLNSLKSFKF